MTSNTKFKQLKPLFIDQILKGLGQIMLQENAITGLFFLLGIFYGSIFMGLGALLATICGTLTARLLRYDKAEIDKGLYGFSAALVGVAVTLFLQPIWLSWLLIIVGSAAAAIIQQFFIKRKIPVFTLPFVVVTWVILFLVRLYFPNLSVESSAPIVTIGDYFTFALKGFGQVIFQGNLISGILFFIGVFISAPIAALYALAASLISGILSFYFSVSSDDIALGLASYNAVLCAIVFAGFQLKDSLWVLASVVLSLAVSFVMSHYQFVPLTFPFVVAACILTIVKSKFVKP